MCRLREIRRCRKRTRLRLFDDRLSLAGLRAARPRSGVRLCNRVIGQRWIGDADRVLKTSNSSGFNPARCAPRWALNLLS